MTCIAAISHNGTVFMGADSAGIAGLSLTIRKDPKIYKVGNFIFGFTDSFRMGQLLGYKFDPPKHYDDKTIEQYMHTDFIESLRVTLRDGGFSRSNNGEESAGTFLVGYKGRLFKVESDYQIGENVEPFDAVGCGAELAIGALFATKEMKPEQRLNIALEAAEAFSAGVRRPFWVDVLTA